MPGMDGFETAKAIRERETQAHTPIIFLTAFSDDLKSSEAYAHGAVDYIQTPVVPAILRAKVKVLADFVRMTEELNRRRHQEVLQEGAERLKLILDSSLDAVVSMDEQGKITGWNPQAEAVFGWPRDAVIGESLADLIIPNHIGSPCSGGWSSPHDGEGPLLRRRLELTALRKLGVEFPVELTISPLRVGDHNKFCTSFATSASARRPRSKSAAMRRNWSGAIGSSTILLIPPRTTCVHRCELSPRSPVGSPRITQASSPRRSATIWS